MITRDRGRTARLHVLLYPGEHEWLKKIADKKGISMSELVRDAINTWLDVNEIEEDRN